MAEIGHSQQKEQESFSLSDQEQYLVLRALQDSYQSVQNHQGSSQELLFLFLQQQKDIHESEIGVILVREIYAQEEVLEHY